MKMIDIFDRLDNTCVAFLMALWGCQIFTSCSTFRYTIPFTGIVIEIFFNAFLFTLFWHLFFLNSVTNGNCILFQKLFWTTVRKVVVMFQKKRWDLRLKAENLQNFEITWTIYSDSERSVWFLKLNAFLTYLWRYFKSKTLEQLEFKLKNKMIGILLFLQFDILVIPMYLFWTSSNKLKRFLFHEMLLTFHCSKILF
jgi:hypothetical protein